MNERRRPRPAAAVLRGKIRQIEERMARIEDHLEVIRIAAARSRGLPIRLRRLERKAGAQVARVRRTLKDSVARLSRAAAVAKTRGEVARQVAAARAKLQDSLDRLGGTLAESSQGVKREMEHLRRGLEAGLRAGAEAYRRRKR